MCIRDRSYVRARRAAHDDRILFVNTIRYGYGRLTCAQNDQNPNSMGDWACSLSSVFGLSVYHNTSVLSGLGI